MTYGPDIEALQKRGLTNKLSGLSLSELQEIFNTSSLVGGGGPIFRSGNSVLRKSGVTIDPAITSLKQDALGLARTGLENIQQSRADTLGTRDDFIQNRLRGIEEGIGTEREALGERLDKTMVKGAFGEQTKESFETSAQQKLQAGEMLAIDEFNALSSKLDIMEGSAAELLKSIDVTDFAQQMEARGLSQELTNKLIQIQKGWSAQSNTKSAQNRQMAGNLIMAMAMFSDRRLKRNIKKVGKLSNGLNLYTYIYVWGEKAIGVMAQEVMKVIPDAVLKHESGYYMVDYSKVLTNGTNR